jgi:hypothetical protein
VSDLPAFPAPPGALPPAPAPLKLPPAYEPGEGPPWEIDLDLASWFATAGEVLVSPRRAFGGMRRSGGLGLPLLYYVIRLGTGMLGTALWRAGMMAIRGRFELMSAGQMAAIVAGALVAAFAVTLVVLFVFAAIVQSILALQGAGRHGYEATFRTLAYAHGSAAPWGLVPMIGSTIGGVWAIAICVPGLAAMHETTTGKAAVAVLVPVLACCGVTALFIVAVVATALRDV